MQLDPTTLDYLSGKRFSNAATFALGNRGRALRRCERLVELTRDQRVLHVGCCDHLDLIRDKIDQGAYLHQSLCRVATRCVGVDVNLAGVSLLHELGFPDVYAPDDMPAEVVDAEFDICLLADVIEHVGDVVSFLKSMRRYRFRELLIVTPNVFRLRNLFSLGEVVNTDHRFWFSPYTLCKVVVDAEYWPQRVELCHSDHVSWRGALQSRLLDALPKYRDTLIVSAQRRTLVAHIAA